MGLAARAHIAAPNTAAETTRWLRGIERRRAVARATRTAPKLMHEKKRVKACWLPPRASVINNGVDTEKLKARVPMIAIITIGTNRSGLDLT